MISRRPGTRFNRRGIGVTVAAATDPDPNDLRNVAGAEYLYSWHRAESGITTGATMSAQGGATVTATLSGGDYSLVKSMRVWCDTAGTVGSTAKFSWSFHETGGGVEQSGVTMATTPTLLPGTGGVSVEFSAGTTVTANFWRSNVISWAPLVATGNCTLDNSTVTASPGVHYESTGLNDTRASVYFSPGILGNQSGMPANVNGTNKGFHLFWVGECQTLPTVTNQFAGWAYSSTTQTAKDVMDWLVTGPSTATIGDRWSVQQITDAAVTQRYNSVQDDGTTALRPTLSPYVFDLEFNPAVSTVYYRQNGILVATGTWSGALLVDRFTLGGVKLGTNAATAFLTSRISDFAQYTQALDTSTANAVRLALA